jgi:hypothetical protein
MNYVFFFLCVTPFLLAFPSGEWSTPELKPFISTRYIEKNLYDPQDQYQSRMPAKNEYGDYFIEDVFFGLRSSALRNYSQRFQLELNIYTDTDFRNYTFFIIHDINIVTSDGKDHKEVINEFFPIIFRANKNEEETHETHENTGGRHDIIITDHSYILYMQNSRTDDNLLYSSFIHYKNDNDIYFNPPRKFNVTFDIELVKKGERVRKAITYFMMPKREWHLFQ